MITKYVKGDLIEGFNKTKNHNVIVHQTNCITGTKVSGVAKAIIEAFPETKSAFRSVMFCMIAPTWLGKHVDFRGILNFNTQYYPGSPTNKEFTSGNIRYNDDLKTRYEALDKCLKLINLYVPKKTTLHIPLYASGTAKDPSKEHESDLDYFKKYIAPYFDRINNPVIVYYL